MNERSFKVGYRFYYWDYYKNKDKTYHQTLQQHNIRDFNYSPKELFVESKYDTIKDEILNNTIYNLDQRKLGRSLDKANKYIITERARKGTALRCGTGDFLHYGIKPKAPLSLQHILSVILYTDWTELSTAFSSTFRSISQQEKLSSVKSRNREFRNWSKTLRETVEYFGNNGEPPEFTELSDGAKKEIEKYQEYDFVTGPFYSGLSFVMVIPEFNIRINSPTSTTKQMAVAERFATDDGMVITLNNNGYYQSNMLSSWDCRWISNFPGEDELLWMGGFAPIRLETVRMSIDGKLMNFEQYFRALFYFDCMVTGVSMTRIKHRASNKDFKILSHLQKRKMGIGGFCNEYPEYINDTFKAYTSNKTQIIINIGYIESFFNKLQGLIMYKVSCKPVTKRKNKTANLLKPIVFDLFHNLKNIVIGTTCSTNRGTVEYEIDILSLLRELDQAQMSKDISITIRASRKYQTRGNMYNQIAAISSSMNAKFSWLSLSWNKSSESIKSKCKAKKWKVSFSETNVKYGNQYQLEDQLIIRKSECI